MALPTQSTEPILIHSENLNSRQFKEYQHVLNMLEDKDSLIYNYALEETVRLTEGWESTNEADETNETAVPCLRCCIASNFFTMIHADVRDSLYKSVSKYWQIFRNADSINANVTFTLREIRTCLQKIKDDRPSTVLVSRGGNIVDVIINVLQKEHLSSFTSFHNFINFKYAAGTWYYKWKIKREKYFISRRKYLKDTSNPKEIERFYKKLHRSSNKEFDKVKRKNTTYRNFKYKILKFGRAVAGFSLPDNIDTLLIGYLDLTQRLLEEFFTQMENHIRKTITLCYEIIEINIKKQLTFKAVEILYVIKENSNKEEIKDEIELKFEYWSNYSQPPQHKLDDTLITPNSFDFTSSSKFNKTPLQPPDTPNSIYTSPLSPLNTPTSHEEQREKQKQRRRLNVFQKVRQQRSVNTRKRVVDDVKKLFKERRIICENIKEIKAECELLDNKNVGEDLFLTKLKEILEEKKKRRKEKIEKVEVVTRIHLIKKLIMITVRLTRKR